MSSLVLSLVIVGAVLGVAFLFQFLKSKRPIYLLNIVLTAGALVLAYYLITGIQAPIEFDKEKQYRYSFVIENLKDIRKAELAYKDEHGVFTGDFDELINFVKYDSMKVVRKLGTLPDTLTESMARDMGITIAELPYTITKRKAKKVLNKKIKQNIEVTENTTNLALDLGFLIRDTIKISVMDTVFGSDYPIDSLRYVPFSTKGAEFTLAAGVIETASKVKVQVFEAKDTDPFDPNHVLQVGSLTEATNNAGNWE